MIEFGRRCESGKHATESQERLFGRLVATELITITLCEGMLNPKDFPHVRRQLMELYTTADETIETQIKNHSEDKIARIARQNQKACTDAFRDSINQFINYWDENMSE